MMKIATWNVNSLRVRLPHVLTWLSDVQPDVLALQETKLLDADFPLDAIQEAGYSAIYAGQKTYNGMAILSREPCRDVICDFPEMPDPQRRILGATIQGIRLFNVYVPNGESVDSEKYRYKLQWLQHLTTQLKQALTKYAKVIVLGDFNIAPDNIDVHDPQQWEGHVLFSEAERSLFHHLLALGFEDCFRRFAPSEQAFSWWDYRMNAFKRNMGLRIDHILASPEAAKHLSRCLIDKAPRKWERPSDHAPVVAEFSL